MRIRIQHFSYRIQGFVDQKLEKRTHKLKEKPLALKKEHPAL
jgi:hypothetical protein